MIDVVEVLQHWHAGRAKSVVATSLGIDPKTVRKYRPARADRTREGTLCLRVVEILDELVQLLLAVTRLS